MESENYYLTKSHDERIETTTDDSIIMHTTGINTVEDMDLQDLHHSVTDNIHQEYDHENHNSYDNDHHIGQNVSDSHHEDHKGQGHDLHDQDLPFYKYIQLSIAAGAIVGNLLVLYVILRSKKMRAQLPNWFMINQSVLNCLFAVMIILVNVGGHGEMYSGVFWQFYCRVIWSKWPCWSVKVSSSYNLVAISLERYLMTVHPMTYRNHVKPKMIIATIATVWAIGNIVPVFTVFTTRLEDGICKILQFWPSKALFTTFGVVHTLFMVVIPLVVMCFTYGYMYFNMKQKGMKLQVDISKQTGAVNAIQKLKNEKIAAREMNILMTCMCVVVCYGICNIPESIRILVEGASDVLISHDTNILGMITIMLFHLDCAVNLFIYTIKYELFRKEFKKYMLCKKIRGSRIDPTVTDTTKMKTISIAPLSTAVSICQQEIG